jgi:serine O-acetyltransferase
MLLKAIPCLLATVRFFFCLVRLIPCGILILFSRKRRVFISADLVRWVRICFDKNASSPLSKFYFFVRLMDELPEFRSLVYYRLGSSSALLALIFPPMQTLYLSSKNIGEGLFIQHGFSTIVSAEKIERNCWIGHQVTIGHRNSRTDCPTLEEDVVVCAGAVILGKIRVGKGSIIGANAVVIKDVPAHCTVVGVPGYIVKRNGQKVRESL